MWVSGRIQWQGSGTKAQADEVGMWVEADMFQLSKLCFVSFWFNFFLLRTSFEHSTPWLYTSQLPAIRMSLRHVLPCLQQDSAPAAHGRNLLVDRPAPLPHSKWCFLGALHVTPSLLLNLCFKVWCWGNPTQRMTSFFKVTLMSRTLMF